MIVFNAYRHCARTQRAADALVARGDEVDCICLRRTDHPQVDVINGVKIFCYAKDKHRGTKLISHAAQHLFFCCFAFLTSLREHCRKPYDIVQIHTLPDYLVFVAALLKLSGVKIVLDVHELMPEIYMSKFGAREDAWTVRLLTWIERASVRFAHKAIAVHQPHLEALARHGNPREKFNVLLNVPDSRFPLRPAHRPRTSRRFCVTYHGLITNRTGFDIALHAVALARREIPDLEFRMIGGGDGFEPAMKLARDLQLNDCVRFIGGVPHEEIPALISDADLGIIPYPNDQFTRYVLPVKLLEYVALGIPVIASRLETMSAYFDESMLGYVQPGNVAELAEQIVGLYRNPEQRQELAANAQKFTERYNWENEKLIYFDLIDSLLLPAVSEVGNAAHKPAASPRARSL